VATTIGLIAFVPTLSSASTPDLPALTPQQLIEKVQQANVDAFSGTFALTTDLGIPNLSSLQQQGEERSGFNPMDLLSGTHSVDIKADGPEHQSVIMRGDMTEDSVWHNGRDVWTWQSTGQKVTHVILPEHKADGEQTPAEADGPVPTPPELAKQFLDEVTPSTNVSVTTPAYVADRAVYSLVLAPKAAESTIDHVAMAVDAANGTPLEVSVFAKGKEKPALQLGFTSIDFSKPSGPFTFTPPPGATVTTKDLTKERAADHAAPDADHADAPSPIPSEQHDGQEPTTIGQDWSTVVLVPGVELRPGTEEARLVYQATDPVSGSFGSGRLLHTNLVNALLLPDGRVFAGFVTPQALQAAAAGAK
jgi:outer membrane lipoprotein-sorting protein